MYRVWFLLDNLNLQVFDELRTTYSFGRYFKSHILVLYRKHVKNRWLEKGLSLSVFYSQSFFTDTWVYWSKVLRIQPTKLQQQQHVSAFTDCMCILYTLTDKTESYGYRLSICVSNWNIIIIGSPEVIFIVITSPQSRKPGIILQIPDPDIMYLWNTCPLAFWQVVEHWTYCTRIIVNWIDIGPNM